MRTVPRCDSFSSGGFELRKLEINLDFRECILQIWKLTFSGDWMCLSGDFHVVGCKS
jgi:hypothetical protein